jgi:hypothetical protein
MWAIAITFRPSVNISHFNLLLRNHWANCNQTLVERSPPRDHPCQAWFNLVQRFQRRRFKCDLLSKYKLNQTWQGWVPFKILSDSHALHPRWPQLLKIEISSNGQNCFILNQNVPKFELYKHNDELQSLVEIGSIVSEKIFFKFHPLFFLICIKSCN